MSVRTLQQQASVVGRGRGIVLALASAAAFGTSGVLAKSLLATGWSPGAAVTARITVAAALLVVPAVPSLRGQWHQLRANAGLIASYGLVAVAGCQVFYFNAVRSLSVGVALLLEYLGLVLVVGWLWARRGQRPRRATVAGVVLSVVGLVLVLDVANGLTVDAGGVLWGLGAAIGLATYFVQSGRQATGLPPMVLAAAGMVVGAAGLAVAGLVGLVPMEASTADVTLLGAEVAWFVPVLGLAVVAGAFAYAVGIAATRALGSKLSSFLGLTEVLFAVVFAWIALDEVLAATQLVGGALIVAGVLAVRADEPPGEAATDRHDRSAPSGLTIGDVYQTTVG